jgi:uncharacterized protein YukE
VGRVLATDDAKSAIQQMNTLVNGSLEQLLGQLDAQGQKLSDPSCWDGARAIEFRSTVWPETSKSLRHVKTVLDDLRVKLDGITTDIMRAGGDS